MLHVVLMLLRIWEVRNGRNDVMSYDSYLVSIEKLCSYADSVSICTSKGLAAPVGSLLCSDAQTVTRAHRIRKALGGGMRQAGIIAAGCKLYRLDQIRLDILFKRYMH